MRLRWQPGYAERSEMKPAMEGVVGSAAASHHKSFVEPGEADGWNGFRPRRMTSGTAGSFAPHVGIKIGKSRALIYWHSRLMCGLYGFSKGTWRIESSLAQPVRSRHRWISNRRTCRALTSRIEITNRSPRGPDLFVRHAYSTSWFATGTLAVCRSFNEPKRRS